MMYFYSKAIKVNTSYSIISNIGNVGTYCNSSGRPARVGNPRLGLSKI